MNSPPEMPITHLLFSTDGRISRKTYWKAVGIMTCYGALSILCMPIMGALGVFEGGFFIYMGLQLLAIFPWVCIMVKRLHDMNRSGVWVIVVLFLHVLGIILLGCIKGTEGSNNYDYFERTEDIS